jgi:hypothetical protein
MVSKLPIPTGTHLAWQRTLLDRAYVEEIAAARKLQDKEKVVSLERDDRFELDMHDEEEDAHLTNTLLAKARRLHVPVPHLYNEDKTLSEHWYEGHYTGRWCLRTCGVGALREEIRREVKARHEARAHWVVWLSALTGVIGAITGLVALLAKCK